MIVSKKELIFYIQSDRIMNGFPAKPTIKEFIKELFHPQKSIITFLYYMRCCSYYSRRGGILGAYYKFRYYRASCKLGFSIDYNVFGYGLVIPHYGTIVVGGPNVIGNFAVLHTSTCIAQGGKNIGDGLYLSTGSVITGSCTLGDSVSVASNSVVNKNIGSNVLIAGAPAVVKSSNYPAWYNRDGLVYADRVKKVIELKLKVAYNENFN